MLSRSEGIITSMSLVARTCPCRPIATAPPAMYSAPCSFSSPHTYRKSSSTFLNVLSFPQSPFFVLFEACEASCCSAWFRSAQLRQLLRQLCLRLEAQTGQLVRRDVVRRLVLEYHPDFACPRVVLAQSAFLLLFRFACQHHGAIPCFLAIVQEEKCAMRVPACQRLRGAGGGPPAVAPPARRRRRAQRTRRGRRDRVGPARRRRAGAGLRPVARRGRPVRRVPRHGVGPDQMAAFRPEEQDVGLQDVVLVEDDVERGGQGNSSRRARIWKTPRLDRSRVVGYSGRRQRTMAADRP